jgi:hypothetical protein
VSESTGDPLAAGRVSSGVTTVLGPGASSLVAVGEASADASLVGEAVVDVVAAPGAALVPRSSGADEVAGRVVDDDERAVVPGATEEADGAAVRVGFAVAEDVGRGVAEVGAGASTSGAHSPRG